MRDVLPGRFGVLVFVSYFDEFIGDVAKVLFSGETFGSFSSLGLTIGSFLEPILANINPGELLCFSGVGCFS